MRVLQLIDSLNTGGAERMAVQIANALANVVSFSGLCVSRKEGVLKASVSTDVAYIFVKKTSKVDVVAISKAVNFCKTNKVQYLHAHSTSYAFAIQIKLCLPKLKIVWHDHYGNSNFLNKRPKAVLKMASNFFSGSIAVNETLKLWAINTLHSKNVTCINNFYATDLNTNSTGIKLKGKAGKRVVCLANLRPQKDHLFLITSFSEVLKSNPDWTLHLLGHYTEDDYYKQILNAIAKYKITQNVFIYGSITMVNYALCQADIGVLSSKSEGLPLALLEYGMAKLPVITTNVGQCATVVGNNGKVIEHNDFKAFQSALSAYMNSKDEREKDAEAYYVKIKTNFSKERSIQHILNFYNLIQ